MSWKRREEHPELFENGDQYLVAVHCGPNGGPYRWEYAVVRVDCDEGRFALNVDGEPWGWEWDDVEFYARLSEFRLSEHPTAPNWEASPLDDITLHYIACEIDHDLREKGVAEGELRIRWNNRSAGMLLKTVEYYRKGRDQAYERFNACLKALRYVRSFGGRGEVDSELGGDPEDHGKSVSAFVENALSCSKVTTPAT